MYTVTVLPIQICMGSVATIWLTIPIYRDLAQLGLLDPVTGLSLSVMGVCVAEKLFLHYTTQRGSERPTQV